MDDDAQMFLILFGFGYIFVLLTMDFLLQSAPRSVIAASVIGTAIFIAAIVVQGLDVYKKRHR